MDLECWEDLNDFLQALSGDTRRRWVYRGSRYPRLETTLERAALEFGLPPDKLPTVELGLLRQFARHYHHYSAQIPEPDNYLEWCSIMRHYGAPSRLLDFTYSFFVALYFALEGPHDFGREPCHQAYLWAIEQRALENSGARLLDSLPADVQTLWRSDPGLARYRTFTALFMGPCPVPLVAVVSPYRRNERLTIQQGTFVCPGDIRRSFVENLTAVVDTQDERVFQQVTIRVSQSERANILARLNNMNMNHATLFPGLEGLASSLRHRLASDEILLYTPRMDNPLQP